MSASCSEYNYIHNARLDYVVRDLTRRMVGVYVAGKKIDRDSLQLARQNDPGFEPISPVDF